MKERKTKRNHLNTIEDFSKKKMPKGDNQFFDFFVLKLSSWRNLLFSL